ncbi:MAG: TonB-dependent receptor, partial [Candidatus Eisenbacteria sp.]|nr:TonB-dependent receptor [Candidatus Eisenbacteria bacterium]
MLRRIGLTALMLAGFAQAGFAQAQEQSYLTMSLEELLDVRVTSVSKTEKAIRDAPVMAFVITRSMIQQRHHHDLLDLLADLPGIHVVDFASAEHASSEIFVRGVSANRKLLILVDGHKINPPTGEPFTFLRNIPLACVQQVEFSYGSSSSLYGADAMAGIVNIVTRTGDHSPPTRLELSAGTHGTGEVQLSIGHRFPSGVGFAVSGKYHESDVEDLPEHFPDVFRGYDVDLSEHSHNLHIKAEYKGLHLSYYRLRGSRNNAISFRPDLYDYSGDCVWQVLNQFYTLDYDWDIAQHWSTKTLIAHSSTELRPPSTYTTDFLGYGYTPHYFDWEGRSTRFAQELHCNWEPVCLVLGGEIENFESTPKTELDNPLGEYNLDYENWGLFSQAEYEPNESLEFTAGLRYDHSSRYEEVWNPRLGAVYKPSSRVRLRGNWGTS